MAGECDGQNVAELDEGGGGVAGRFLPGSFARKGIPARQKQGVACLGLRQLDDLVVVEDDVVGMPLQVGHFVSFRCLLDFSDRANFFTASCWAGATHSSRRRRPAAVRLFRRSAINSPLVFPVIGLPTA